MKPKLNSPARPLAQIAVCLLLLLLSNLNCTMPNKFWRDYEQKPFNSQK